jgi:glucokinase
VASVNVPLEDVDFRARMEERLGLPVAIDNDATAAAIAEWRFGAGRGSTDMLMVTLGTGVGGGLVLGGRPYRGWSGAGGELGHIVVLVDGRACFCGGHGLLEEYVSGNAANRAARETFGPAADAHRLVRLGNEGDPRALMILDEMGRYLGAGIASMLNALEPELVVIGGGFAAAGELLLAPARRVIAREALTPGRDARLVRAELGTSAGMIGAALVAFELLDEAP